MDSHVVNSTEEEEEDIQVKVLQNTLAEVAASEEQKCCVICLDTIAEVCEARPCCHRHFDYLCLLSWLQQQTKCPLCKSDVREVWYDFQDDGVSEDTSRDDAHRVYVVPQPKETSLGQQQRPRPQTQPSGRAGPAFPPLDRGQAFRRRRVVGYQPPRPVTEDEALVRRRRVYREQLYSLHVGTSLRTGYRDLTPQVFESDPELVSRARKWLRRELQVFQFLRPDTDTSTSASSASPATGSSGARNHAPSGLGVGDRLARRRANNAEFLLEYIVAILKTVDIRGSQGQAEEMLKDFLGRGNTRLLLHELASFLRSPYSIEVWDRKVQYPLTSSLPSGPKRRRERTRHYNHESEGEQEEDEEGGWQEGHRWPRRRRLMDETNPDEVSSSRIRRGVDTYRPDHSRYYDRRRHVSR